MSCTEFQDLPLRSAVHTVTVRAPGRLHLGFLDPSGTLGRPFGGLGLMVEGFETVVELGDAPSDRFGADTAAARGELERVAGFVQRLREHTGRLDPVALQLREALPLHAGFGSGTQLALAVGRAFAHWQGLEVSTSTLAQWLGRGLRSGIGIAGFDVGGLLVDGGPGRHGQPAPLVARLEVPLSWRVVVVQHEGLRGLSGAAERAAIAALAPLPQSAAAQICHEVLMRVLPGAAGDDFTAFAAGVNRVQRLLGEHFAPAQGGSRWSSASVGRLMAWLHDAAGEQVAIGQSSWGPTGFAIVASANAAQALVDSAIDAGVVAPELRLSVVRVRQRGALVTAAARE